MESVASAAGCMHTWDVGEGHLWNVMVRMTETAHPHSIGHGEFHVASQPEEEMSKIFVASYVRGFTAARTKLYGLFEKVLLLGFLMIICWR